MLDALDDNSLRVVRKYFQEKGLPLTEENLAQFAGSDAQKQVFIYTAVEEGMNRQAASDLYDSVQSEVAKSVGVKPIEPGPRMNDALGAELTSEMEEDILDAKQVDKLPLGVGETLGKPEKPESTEPVDEFTITEMPKKDEGWVEDFKYVTKPEDEPFPQSPVDKPVTKDDLDWNQFFDANKQAVEPVSVPNSPLARTEPDITNYDATGTGVATGAPNAATPADKITKALNDGKPHVEDEVDPNTGSMSKIAVQRPSEKPGATVVGTTPGQQLRVNEPGAREPKELFNKITNTPGLSQQEMLIGFSAADKLLNATKEKPAKLTPQEKVVLGKAGIPSMSDGTPANLIEGKQIQKEQVENKFIDPKTEEEFWKTYQEYDTARAEQAAKDNTEDKETMRDMMFAARARGVGAKKDYTEGLSAIDKKKFLDGIVKGFGQIVAGTTGHLTGTDVGSRFKYDLTDFAPKEKQLTDVYNTALKEVGDEVKMLQDNLTKMDKEAAGKRVDTLKDRLEMLIKFAGLTQTKSSMSTEAETRYAGLYQQMQDMMKYLLDVQKMIAYRDKPPPSTTFNTTTNVDAKTQTGIDQTTQITPQQQDSMKKLQVTFNNKYDGLLRIKEPTLRTDQLEIMLSPHGISAGRVIERMRAMGMPPDRWEDHKKVDVIRVFNNAVSDEMRNLSIRQQNTQSDTVSTGISTKTPGQGAMPQHNPPKSNVAVGEFIPPLNTPQPKATPTAAPTATESFKNEAQLKSSPGVGMATPNETGIKVGAKWTPAANSLYGNAVVGGAVVNGGDTLKLYISRPGKKIEVKEIPINSPEAEKFIQSRK